MCNWDTYYIGSRHPSLLSIRLRAGGAPASLSVTTTHSGTAQYVLGCPQDGTYEVEIGGTPVTGSPFSCTSTAGAMEFTSAAGALAIGETTPVTLSVLPLSLSFSGTVGGATPADQNVAADLTGGAGTIAAPESCAWLSIAGTGAAPATLVFSVDTSGLVAGPYSCNVTVSSEEATEGSPQTVTVSLTMSTAVYPTGVSSGRFSGVKIGGP